MKFVKKSRLEECENRVERLTGKIEELKSAIRWISKDLETIRDTIAPSRLQL